MKDMEDFDEVLCDLVREHPNLYNSYVKGYKDSASKDNSWVSIAARVHSSPELCSRRWRTLRDRFSRELATARALAKSGDAEGNEISLSPFYHIISWLKPYIRKRRSYGSAHKPRTTNCLQTSLPMQASYPMACSSNSSLQQTYVLVEPDVNIPSPNGSITLSSASSPSPQTSHHPIIENPTISSAAQSTQEPTSTEPFPRDLSFQAAKKQKVVDLEKCLTSTMSSFNTFMERRNDSSDADGLFAASLATTLRQMPPRVNMAAKAELMQVMVKYVAANDFIKK